jgi:hypothetical protein
MSHGSLWATGLKHKEKSNIPVCAARQACSQRTRAYFKGARHQDHHEPARRVGSQRNQCLEGVQICSYRATAVQRQHYGSLAWHRYSVKRLNSTMSHR